MKTNMHRTTLLTRLMLLALCLASCTANELLPDTDNTGTGNTDPALITFNIAPPPAYREVNPDGTPAPATRVAQTDAAAQWEEGDVIWIRADFYDAPNYVTPVETSHTALIFGNGQWRPFTTEEAKGHNAENLTNFTDELRWPGTMAQKKENRCELNAWYLGKGLPDQDGKITLDCTVNLIEDYRSFSPGARADIQFSQGASRIRITKGCNVLIKSSHYTIVHDLNKLNSNVVETMYPFNSNTPAILTTAQDFFVVCTTDTRIIVNGIPVSLRPDAYSNYGGLSYTIDPDALTNGTGTPLPPGYDLTISTADELQAFAAAVNSGAKINGIPAATAAVLQTADIDLAGIDDWEPIGNYALPSTYYFNGIYNGNGHTISNLRIRGGRQSNGLFGVVGLNTDNRIAILTGIHLRGVDILVNNTTIGDFTGALAAAIGGDKTVVSFCSAQGKIRTESPLGSYAGGIVGYAESVINHCRADVEVAAVVSTTDKDHLACAGGIAGANYGTILGCESTGSAISAEGGESAYAGGITGYNVYNTSRIYFCAAKVGTITATNGKEQTYAGGLVGRHDKGELRGSYSRGDATATSSYNNTETGAGAIVGKAEKSTTTTAYCFGTGKGEAGTSGLGADAYYKIVYDTDATDEEIWNVVKDDRLGSIFLFTIITTTYDANRFPEYGIEQKSQTFQSNAIWQYPAPTLQLDGFPPMPPMQTPYTYNP